MTNDIFRLEFTAFGTTTSSLYDKRVVDVGLKNVNIMKFTYHAEGDSRRAWRGPLLPATRNNC